MKRALAAIMAVDVVGYTRLMAENEMGTHAMLKDVRVNVLDSRISDHSGEIVKLTGDGLLARFESVIDATRCAVDIQRDMLDRNAQLPENRRLMFRIGVNIGETIIEKEDIYGNGVNIAARIEQLAEPGGVLVTEAAFNHLSNKTAFRFEHIGKKRLKNVADPVTIYNVVIVSQDTTRPTPSKWRSRNKMAAFSAAGVACAAFLGIGLYFMQTAGNDLTTASGPDPSGTLPPEKPTIAVLPFDDMSEQANSTSFADGMTEDLITDLSKLSGILVISRNSTFTYKGQVVKPQDVHRDLGARYIVEGSIRRGQEGQDMRINAQLIDATSGVHVWAERYDAKMTDIFSVQDKLTAEIVESLAVQLSDAERKRLAFNDTEDIAAYEAFQKGWQHFQSNTPEDLAAGLAQFQRATELDPAYGRAYAAIGHTYWKSWVWGWEASIGETYLTAPKRAEEFLAKAKETRPTANAHQLAAELAIYDRRYAEAISEAEQAINMDPNETNGLIIMAEVLIYAGRPGDALQHVKTAILLDPLNPAYANFILGLIHFGQGQLEESIPLFESALEANPDDFAPAAPLAAAHAHLGNDAPMKAALEIYLEGWPDANIQEFRDYWPYRAPEDEARLLDGLRKAGMPEG